MPGPQQDSAETPELADAVFGSQDQGAQDENARSGPPDWGGVDLTLGDNSDAMRLSAPEEDPANGKRS